MITEHLKGVLVSFLGLIVALDKTALLPMDQAPEICWQHERIAWPF